MILKPKMLVSQYSGYSPLLVDYANVIKSWIVIENKPQSWWKKWLSPAEISVDLGGMANLIASAFGLTLPELKVKFNKSLESKIDAGTELTDAHKEMLIATAMRLQKRFLTTQSFALNIECHQNLSDEEIKLLDCPVENPSSWRELRANSVEHGDLVVIDAALNTVRAAGGTNIVDIDLSDYPAFLRRPEDGRLRLRVGESVRKLLGENDALRPNWHPYCRTLGRYVEVNELEPVLEVLLISLRTIPSLSPSLGEELHAEWRAMQIDVAAHFVGHRKIDPTELQVILELENLRRHRMLAPDISEETFFQVCRQEIKDKLGENSLQEIRSFEDDITSGCFAFLLGVYHALETVGKQKFRPAAEEIANKVVGHERHLLWPLSGDEWSQSLRYLEPLGVVRFTRKALQDIFEALELPLGSSNGS